jgi:hypothetical protein
MISVVITHSSIESQFIDRQITECRKFSDDIIVVSLKNLMSGEEDKNLRIIYKDDVTHLITTCFTDSVKDKHNTTRWQGYLKAKHDYILFLDGDEIPDGDLYRQHLQTFDYKNLDAVSYRCYWYFREEIYRAKKTEECALLLRKSFIDKDLIFHEAERWNFLNRTKNYAVYIDLDGQIIMHHFSWVRSKQQMLQKVSAWGHANDTNWVELIEEEFSREFSGTDFVHGYEYDIIEKKFC